MEDSKDTEQVDKVEETTQKTYTEQDIQNSFNAGVRKANSEWQKDEKYKEFLEWKKSNQSENERLTELENNNNIKDKEIMELKSLLKIKDSDVKKEFQKLTLSSEELNSSKKIEKHEEEIQEIGDKNNNNNNFNSTNQILNQNKIPNQILNQNNNQDKNQNHSINKQNKKKESPMLQIEKSELKKKKFKSINMPKNNLTYL